MRPSLLRHNLSRLRTFLKLSQAQFAPLIGCNLQRLQNIESRRTLLDDDLAARVSVATGVRIGWLLDNDLASSPLAQDGSSYTVEHFTYTQATAGVGRASELLKNFPDELFPIIARVHGMLTKSLQPMSERSLLLRYKLERFLKSLEQEFECDKRISDDIAERGDVAVGKELAATMLEFANDPRRTSLLASHLPIYQADEAAIRKSLDDNAKNGTPMSVLQVKMAIEERNQQLSAAAKSKKEQPPKKPSPQSSPRSRKKKA